MISTVRHVWIKLKREKKYHKKKWRVTCLYVCHAVSEPNYSW